MTWAARLALAVYLGGFGYGAVTHAADFVRFGWWPYQTGPAAFTLFWNMLVFLDAAVVALLLAGWRRAGLLLAVAVMVVDVAVNSYAVFAFDWTGFQSAVLVQAAFLGFILGSVAFLWPGSAAAGRGEGAAGERGSAFEGDQDRARAG